MEYSYKHPSLVTVIVTSNQSTNRNSPAPNDTSQWHLPTFDPRNETKYMYRLHTIDIYFWTKEDALDFVNAARRVLPPQQTTIRDEPAPPPPHMDQTSAVVQKLEHMAVSDPSYGHGRDSRGSASRGNNVPTFAPPPTNATPQPAPQEPQQPAAFSPMAYNPAAPAAPETVRHREKTPPPEDDAPNPLMAAAMSDHGQSFNQSAYQPQIQSPGPHNSYFPSTAQQPPPTPSFQSPYAPSQQPTSPPPHPGIQHSHTFPASPPPPTNSAGNAYHQNIYAQTAPGQIASGGFAAPPPHPSAPTQYANYPASPGFAPSGALSPAFSPPPTGGHSATPPTYQQSISSPPPHTSSFPQSVHSPPPHGYSQFQYQPTSHTQANSNAAIMPVYSGGGTASSGAGMDYKIHQQAYRPTEGEHMGKVKDKEPRGKLEERAGRLEKGVTGFLKKIEKKYG